MPERTKPQLREVYTDGACSGNPGPGGWAWALDPGNYASGYAQRTTNQRMEIQAAFEAVRALPGPLEVVSDSTYVVNCFKQRWWQGWLARGWINSQKKPVANRDLWEPFIELVRARGDVTFRWVKGHAGHEMNDFADQLAVDAAREGAGRAAGLGVATGDGSPPASARPARPAPRAEQLSLEPRGQDTPADERATEKPTVYLVCGGTGAGKTTHALALAKEKQALRFSIDEWMRTLFSPDIVDIEYEWMLERTQRCERQIWSVCEQALALGGDVVLDLGFTTREHRERFRKLAEQVGARGIVHFVDASAKLRRQRVKRRNAERDPAVFALDVSDEMFDFMEGLFEPPDAGELEGGRRVRAGGRGKSG